MSVLLVYSLFSSPCRTMPVFLPALSVAKVTLRRCCSRLPSVVVWKGLSEHESRPRLVFCRVLTLGAAFPGLPAKASRYFAFVLLKFGLRQLHGKREGSLKTVI